MKNDKNYVAALDGIRAVAVLLIIPLHTRNLTSWSPFLLAGSHAFDIFMVLSGYLITKSLLSEYYRTGDILLWKFYVRRELRLFPPILALLFGTIVCVWMFAPNGLLQVTRSSLWCMFYATNWGIVAGDRMEYFGHLWSLSLQFQFYMFWPAVLLAVLRQKGVRGVFGMALLLALAAQVLRLILVGKQDYGRIYFGTDTHLDSLAYGCALAAWLRWRGGNMFSSQRFANLSLVGAACITLYFIKPMDEKGYFIYGASAVMWLTCVLLADVLFNQYSKLRPLLSWKPLVSVGRISYSVMLWHMLILYIFNNTGASRLAIQMAGTFLSVPLGLLMFVLVEQPCQNVKKRYDKK